MIKLVLAGIAAATAVVGGVMAAKSYRQAADTEEQVGEFNKGLGDRDAAIATQHARELLVLRDRESLDENRRFNEMQAATELALSHNGFMAGTGTPALQLAYNAAQFEEDQRRADYGARTGEREMEERSWQARMQGQLARMTGYQRGAAYRTQAMASLLGGVSSAAQIGASVSIPRRQDQTSTGVG